MTRLSLKWWIAGVLAAVIALISMIPARITAPIIESQSKGMVSLRAVDGTVWNGSAQILVGEDAVFNSVHWEWQPKALFKGQIAFKLDAGDAGHADIALSPAGVYLGNVDLTAPGIPLFKLDKRLVALNLGGSIRLAAPELNIHQSKLSGGLNVDWKNASSIIAPAVNPLGDYRVTLTPSGNVWQVQLLTLGGALQLKGHGEWQPGGHLKFSTDISAAQGSENALAALINQIGPGAPNQVRHLDFTY